MSRNPGEHRSRGRGGNFTCSGIRNKDSLLVTQLILELVLYRLTLVISTQYLQVVNFSSFIGKFGQAINKGVGLALPVA